MHYAIPRILHESGRLERFYTDLYAAQDSWLRLFAQALTPWHPPDARRLLGRVANGVPSSRVKSFPFFGAAYYMRKKLARDYAALEDAFFWAGKTFCAKIVRKGFGDADAVFAYNSAALEVFSAARQRGLMTVLEQTIVPRLLEDELLAEAIKRYPGWDDRAFVSPAAARVAQREREEWEQADLIVCGSEFVREGIRRCGGPVERCVVVPYGVDSQFTSKIRDRRGEALRVLTLGQVILRKGAGCVCTVAEALRGLAVFRWVGPVSLPAAACAKMERHVELVGAVPRSDLNQHYDWADVFLLPSICEGSATAIYEALSCGIPVVTTPNSGSPVKDDVDGFVVPVYDVSAMADRLRQLHQDRDLLARLSEGAAANAKDLSLAAYQRRLLSRLSVRRPS